VAKRERPEVGQATGTAVQLKRLPVELIRKGRFQPRRHFEPQSLEELAQSIQAQGQVQPIVVRPMDAGYELLAGERRWRACQHAGLDEIDAIIREVNDADAPAIALIENVHRDDLNPVEKAQAIQRLIEQHDYTQGDAADALGMSRTAVTNTLRLLKLEPEVRDLVSAGQLSEGAAKSIAGRRSYQQVTLARNAIRMGWNARQIEQRVADQARDDKGQSKKNVDEDRYMRRLAELLSEHLGSPCRITTRKDGSIELTIHAANNDILSGVFEKMGFDVDS